MADFESRFAKFKRRKKGGLGTPTLGGLKGHLAKLRASGAFGKKGAKAPGPHSYGAGCD